MSSESVRGRRYGRKRRRSSAQKCGGHVSSSGTSIPYQSKMSVTPNSFRATSAIISFLLTLGRRFPVAYLSTVFGETYAALTTAMRKLSFPFVSSVFQKALSVISSIESLFLIIVLLFLFCTCESQWQKYRIFLYYKIKYRIFLYKTIFNI